jgi:catalase
MGRDHQPGHPISDNQNSLKAGARGPVLLEDFILREKIIHFDHERIPERDRPRPRLGRPRLLRVLYESLSDSPSADFLPAGRREDPGVHPVLDRGRQQGLVDLPRDVRGFAVKFYTRRATSISSATTSRCSSSRTPSSSPT